MKNIFFSLVVGFVLILPVSVHAASTTPTVTVTLKSFQFSPKRVTITPGTTVKWVHAQSGMLHDVDSDDGSFSSDDLRYKDTFKHKFRKAGTFRYHCSFHGDVGGVGMAGTIVVKTKK